MNSWEIIKEALTKESRPGSVGWEIQAIKAAELFLKLQPQLRDWYEAASDFNADERVRQALINSSVYTLLREDGIFKEREE